MPRRLFADTCSGIALAFLERYPTPSSALGLDERRLTAFLAKHRYSGRPPGFSNACTPPPRASATAQARAQRDAVLGYVTVVRALNTSIKSLDRSIAANLGLNQAWSPGV